MNTNINIRIDKETKNEAEQLFTNLGFNMTTAINMFIRQALLNRGLPFSIKEKQGYLTPTDYLEKEIVKGKNDDKNGNTTSVKSDEKSLTNFFNNEIYNK